MTVVGPFASQGEKPSRKRILVCNPASGPACVDRILATAGAPRLPPAGDRRGDRGAEEVRHAREGRRPVGGAGHRPRDSGDARLAALPVPHRARSLPDTTRRSAHRVSDVELASRLSYFLWNSMPDEELLSLAERRRLSVPARPRRAGDADARRSEGRRRWPRTSPASGWRFAISTASSRIRRSSRPGRPSCATR